MLFSVDVGLLNRGRPYKFRQELSHVDRRLLDDQLQLLRSIALNNGVTKTLVGLGVGTNSC